MNLETGQQLLHYRLIGKIGEGGMGVVWKALDTSLDREVAIKVLPAAFNADAERLARFEREARLLASLNHPRVAAVYGLHECDGMRFLAMEMVEGEDLSDRLQRGALPVDDALEVAGQICEALAAAHDAGVVHRDLKPANVMQMPDGKIKVLDFGLAKALSGDPASGTDLSASISPTMTSAGTQAGMILGTAAYMSPEQARGKPVDRRADIWALGCVLFEMLTGVSVFRGETVTDTLAAVVRADPEWQTLPAGTPPAIERLLRRCLEKDPERRLRDAGDLRLEIADALAEVKSPRGAETKLSGVESAPTATPTSRSAAWSGRLLWAIAGAALAALALFASKPWSSPPAAEPRGAVRFEVAAATGETTLDKWSLAVSPDGRRIVWVVVEGTQRSLWLRDLDTLKTRRLPDTDGASYPAFSPDGRSVAFFAQGKLRRLDLGGRRSIDLCPSSNGAGISWGRDGTILFNDGWISPLSKVSADGGTAEPATELDVGYGEIGHWFPSWLPDGRHVLISRWRTSLNDMTVAVVSLESGEIRDLLPRASFARYVPDGRLMFTRAGAIHVVDFDPETFEISGEPRLLIDGVEQQWDNGLSPWSVSANGVLAYLPGGMWTTKRSIVRVSRDGTTTPVDVEPAAYVHAVISPDGQRLAMTRFENGRASVVIRDLERGVDLTVPIDGVSGFPVWNPDGSEIVFVTSIKGPWDIYRFPADGSSPPELLIEGVPDQMPMAWSPDGRYLVWNENYDDVRLIDLQGDLTPTVLYPQYSETASISPDSQWIAYTLRRGESPEILLRRFPDGERDYQVSIDGGESPLWSRDGRELFYRRGADVLAAKIRFGADGPVVERPRELFGADALLASSRLDWSYDPTTDELIMIRMGEQEISRDRFVVLLDWEAELADREE